MVVLAAVQQLPRLSSSSSSSWDLEAWLTSSRIALRNGSRLFRRTRMCLPLRFRALWQTEEGLRLFGQFSVNRRVFIGSPCIFGFFTVFEWRYWIATAFTRSGQTYRDRTVQLYTRRILDLSIYIVLVRHQHHASCD